MSKYVEKKCVICEDSFSVIYQRRSRETCSKECSYKLRKKNKNTSKPKEKTCDTCNDAFLDRSKLKQQTTCRNCILAKGVATRKENGSYDRTEEQNKKASETLKAKYASGERKFSQEAIENLSKSLTQRWKSGEMRKKSQETCLKKYGVDHWTKSKAGKLKMSFKRKGFKFSKEVRRNMSKAASKRIKSYKIFSFGNGGFREDIGLYVRSNWEANFARILKYNNINFEYESDCFTLKEGLTYTPDFKINNIYFEIKGYMDDISRNKIESFKKEYPGLTLAVISGSEYNNLRHEYKDKIFWEGK